jgi:hypothetical protein
MERLKSIADENQTLLSDFFAVKFKQIIDIVKVLLRTEPASHWATGVEFNICMNFNQCIFLQSVCMILFTSCS